MQHFAWKAFKRRKKNQQNVPSVEKASWSDKEKMRMVKNVKKNGVKKSWWWTKRYAHSKIIASHLLATWHDEKWRKIRYLEHTPEIMSENFKWSNGKKNEEEEGISRSRQRQQLSNIKNWHKTLTLATRKCKDNTISQTEREKWATHLAAK